MEHTFANVGVPAILIGFAVFAAAKHLSGITAFLVGVTVAHFAFIAFWVEMLALREDRSPVIGATTVAAFSAPSFTLAVSCARVWIGFAAYVPFGNDQAAHALRWIIGGVA